MPTKRILIPDTTFNEVAIRAAFQAIIDASKDDASIKRCLLYISTKGSLQGTHLENILGPKIAKQLQDGGDARLSSMNLSLETNRTFKSYTPCDAVIVVYADQNMMDKVDANISPKLVVCIPAHPDAVDGWKRTWSPITPGEPQHQVEMVGNKVVEAALASMTERINLANSMLGPNDNQAVKEAFRILRAHDQAEDPSHIRAWCIKHGWNSKAADEALKHATKAFALRSKPAGHGSHWAENIYEQWAKSSSKSKT